MIYAGSPFKGGVALGDGLNSDQIRDVRRQLEAMQEGRTAGPGQLTVGFVRARLEQALARLTARGEGRGRQAQALALLMAEIDAAVQKGAAPEGQPTAILTAVCDAVLKGEGRAVRQVIEAARGGAGEGTGIGDGEKGQRAAWIGLGAATLAALGATVIFAVRDAKKERISRRMLKDLDEEDGDEGDATEGEEPADGATAGGT